MSKSGGKKAPAVIAVAHLLILLAYQVLQTHQPFHDRMALPIVERQRERLIRHHIRRLGKLGIAVRRYAPTRFRDPQAAAPRGN